MPRLPRLHVPGGFYHVILRGNHREDVFTTAQDRIVLNEIVAESLTRHESRIHAFCWMSNHLHALVQIGTMPLGKLVQHIAARYSRYRHRALQTTGHLFERRHRAWLVEADTYFVALLRYIHLNPVSAGMVERAEDYAWSSHRAYLGIDAIPWLTIDVGLSLFGRTVEVARASYRQLVCGELYASEQRLFDDAHPDDRRVLGGDRFLASLPPQPYIPKRRLTLEALAQRICEQAGVSADDLRAPSKRQLLSALRVELVQQALKGRIASLHEIGRYLGRDPSGLSRLLQRHRARMS